MTVDDGHYSGPTTAATMAEWRARVANSTNWTTSSIDGSGTTPTLLYPNSYSVTDALPVELVSFTAIGSNGGVVLNWKTATEVNNNGFEIQHSSALFGSSWEKIGFIQGHECRDNDK